MYFAFFIGTAGSGKSTLVASLVDVFSENDYNVATLNLDTGVNWLPYTPDVDVRDYIKLEDVALQYNLGPNGAMIASADLTVNYMLDLKDELLNLDPEIVLVDTPGQMELFA